MAGQAAAALDTRTLTVIAGFVSVFLKITFQISLAVLSYQWLLWRQIRHLIPDVGCLRGTAEKFWKMETVSLLKKVTLLTMPILLPKWTL